MSGCVKKRGDVWYAILSSTDPISGKRKRKWVAIADCKGKRHAEEEHARLLREMKGGAVVLPAKTTLAEYLERWLTAKRLGVAPKTWERYAQVCRRNLTPLLGTVRLQQLTADNIADALTTAGTSGHKRGGGLSPRTLHHMLTILKAALQQAVDDGLLVKNPAKAKRLQPKVERKTMHTYDMAQTADLLDVVKGSRIEPAVILAVLCGLRRGEIAALRWGRIKLDDATLAVVESAEQTRAGVRYKPPKSGKTRTVALPASVVEALRAHRVRQAEELLAIGVRLADDTFIVAQADGTPLRPHSIGQEWVRFCRRHPALQRIRFHDLRHTRATHLLASNVHPKVASEMLGHSRVGVTLDLYSHVLPNMQGDAVAIVDRALAEAVKQRKSRVR